MKNMLCVLAVLLIAGCSTEEPDNSTKSPSTASVNAAARLSKVQAPSCMSDAECGPDQNCECVEADNGNCEYQGVCVPRDRSSTAAALLKAKAAVAESNSCQTMSNLSFIPSGHHPTTAQWNLDQQGQIADLVCIAPTRGNQIRVLRWLDYPLPRGYRTLRIESGVDTTFRGCRQWSEWQGRKECITSFDLYVMQKTG